MHGHRPFYDDSIDEGPEFRHMIGIPGGISNNFLMEKIENANKGMLTFTEGKGSDPDNLYKSEFSDSFGSHLFDARAYIMDSEKFKFHIAEKYNQFHDGKKVIE